MPARNARPRRNVTIFDIVPSSGLMKYLQTALAVLLVSLLAGPPLQQAFAQGPDKQQSETVAKPKKKDAPPEPVDQPKIPSEFKKDKDKQMPEGLPTFRSDVNTVQLEVAVLDNNCHFIPKIPPGNFRILGDNVRQNARNFSTTNDAPKTDALTIELDTLVH